MEEGLEYKTEGTFSGQDYIIRVKSSGEQLNIQIESKQEPLWWSNTFTASYLEDLTQKTGSRRSYSEFVECFIAGLARKSESSNVDILTFQDLENMRNKGSTTNQANSSSSSFSSSNSKKTSGSNQKRYLIVTAEIAREKIHYPLSLNLEDTENPEVLRLQIKRMKLEMEDIKEKSIGRMSEYDPQSSKGSFSSKTKEMQSQGAGFFLTTDSARGERRSTQGSIILSEQLKSENDILKSKIKQIEEGASQKKGAVELDNIVRNKFQLEEELEIAKKENLGQIEKLKVSLKEKEDELNKSKTKFYQFQKDVLQTSESVNNEESIRRLREQVIKLAEEGEEEVNKQRRQIQNQTKELERTMSEVDFLKQNDRKQKSRIKQLEIELESAIKKVSTKSTTDRLYSPFNKNTPTGNQYGSGSVSTGNVRRAISVPNSKNYSPQFRNNAQNQAQNNNNSRNSSNNSNQGRNSSNSAGNKNNISPSYQFNSKKNPSTNSGVLSGNKYGIQGSTNNTLSQKYQQNKSPNTSNQRIQQRNQVSGGQYSPLNKNNQNQLGTNKINATSNNRINPPYKQSSPSINSQNRNSPNNRTNQQLSAGYITNNNQKLSPASRYTMNQANKVASGQLGGSKVNNYIFQKGQGLSRNDGKGEEIDQRLDKLQSLLQMAKK